MTKRYTKTKVRRFVKSSHDGLQLGTLRQVQQVKTGCEKNGPVEIVDFIVDYSGL